MSISEPYTIVQLVGTNKDKDCAMAIVCNI